MDPCASGSQPTPRASSGRQPCCQSVPPRPELTFGHTQVSSTLALPWLSIQQLESMSFPRTCSVCCCWRGSNFRSLSKRRCALVAPLLWTLWGATEPHAAAQADSRSGRRVRREGGACVRYNAFLRKMNVGARAADERCIEVLAQDLPCFSGAQLAIDITLRCALSSSGETQPDAADVDGPVLARSRVDKETTYSDFLTGRCWLVVLAIETGGRWRNEAADFVRQLAFAKTQEVPSHMWFSKALVWERRLTRMFSTACSLAFCFLSGVTFRPLHNLVLDRWRATVLGGIARARPAVVVRACVC